MIILFGASGFIGSHLRKLFKDEGVAIDIRQTNWREILPASSKVFINLIGKAHAHQNDADEAAYYFANYEVVKLLFDEFMKSDAQLFIHVSSIAAVEENERNEILTEDSLCLPQSAYGKSKRKAEKWLLSQTLPGNKKIIILRPPMVHGAGDKGNIVILHRFISNKIPYPLSAYQNARSFLSVDNLTYLIEKIVNNSAKLDSGIYHVADDVAVSTNRIVELIEESEKITIKKLRIPKFLLTILAMAGDYIRIIPLTSHRLKKLTGNLIVSNQKIKTLLSVKDLPLTAENGLKVTIRSLTRK